MSIIKFHLHEISTPLKDRRRLKKFLVTLFSEEKKEISSLDYIFCSDHYLIELNQQFLQHNYYTDILTFDLSKKTEPIVGEIYISVDRVKENHKIYGSTLERELHRVIFHGALHLCGYNDSTSKQRHQMTMMENRYLKSYFNVSRGTH